MIPRTRWRAALRVHVAAIAMLLVLAASASGATRYAAPAGAGAEPCLLASPCSLPTAVSGVASGDVVHLLPGTYATTAPLIVSVDAVTIEGEGAPGPEIVYTPTNPTFQALIGSATSLTLRGFRLRTASTTFTAALVLMTDGAIQRVQLRNAGTTAALVASSAEVRDSVIVASTTFDAAAKIGSGALTGSTVVADAGGTARAIANLSGPASVLTIRNSILRGSDFDIAVNRDSIADSATLDVDYSAYRDGSIRLPGVDVTVTEGAHNVHAAPVLVGLAGGADVHQQASSPTIDAGDRAAAAASTTDLDGEVRVIGSAPDIGADEASTTAPAVTLVDAQELELTSTEAVLRGVVNAAGLETVFHFEYGPTDALGTSSDELVVPAGLADVPVSAGLVGLTPGMALHAALVATNSAGTRRTAVRVVGTLPTPPVVIIGAATAVTSSGATLHGTVNPGGRQTTYHFAYGPTAALGTSTADVVVPAGRADVPVSVAISGLAPGTAVHAALVATNSEGTATSSEQVLTTLAAPPVATIGAASGVTSTGLTVNGTVAPGGAATTYRVEYGTDTTYGSTTPPVALTAGTEAVTVAVVLTGLPPATTIHARLVATNARGDGASADRSTRTLAAPRPAVGRLQLQPTAVRRGRPVTATFSLSVAAKVTLTLDRLVPGRRRAGVCQPGATTGPRCTKVVRRAVIRANRPAGRATTVRIPARLGGRLLAPGRYRVTVTAAATSGPASAKRTATLVVRG